MYVELQKLQLRVPTYLIKRHQRIGFQKFFIFHCLLSAKIVYFRTTSESEVYHDEFDVLQHEGTECRISNEA